jgi:hypothetical protein
MTRFHATFTDYVAPSGWKLSRALRRLDVTTEPFDYKNNKGADGYSYDRVLSIRPEPRMWSPPIIAAHELAHIVLGHTAHVRSVQELALPISSIPFAQFELEAHAVAKAVGYCMELNDEEFKVELVQKYIDYIRNDEDVRPVLQLRALRLACAVQAIVEAGEKSRPQRSDDLTYSARFTSVGAP